MRFLTIILIFLGCCSSPYRDPYTVIYKETSDVPDEIPDDDVPPIKDPIPDFIRFDQQEDVMLQALNGLSEFERLRTRFIICSDQFNADGIDAVKGCRDGVTKALNSISDENVLNDPKAIGPAKSILQVNLNDFGLTASKWRIIEDADPFKFTSETVRGKTLQFLTQTVRPFINGSNFVETALVKAYYRIEEVPARFKAFQNFIGVNLQQDFDNRDSDIIVFGMNESVIATNRQYRLIVRAKGNFGALWCTQDTNDQAIAPVNIDGQLVNLKNVLEAPFPIEARSNKTAVSNAGECIYVKKNGMLGYALFDAAGVRQDFAPTNIVQDNSSASRGLSSTITNARACFRCHATGFIPLKDSLASHIASNTGFNAADKELGRLFFKSDSIGREFFKKDNAAYSKALNDININNKTEDAVNGLTDKLRLEQDINHVAAMLGITAKELRSGLQSSTEASAIMGSLLQQSGKVNLQALIDGLPILIRDMNLFKDDQ